MPEPDLTSAGSDQVTYLPTTATSAPSGGGPDISGGYHITKPPPPLPNEPDASLLARAAIAEAGSNPAGQQAVMGALLQRQAESGKSIAQLIQEPGQIQTYWNGKLQGIDPTSPAFQSTLQAAQAAKPTPGVDSWYSPAGIKAQGFGKPPFDPSTGGTMIGGQLFGKGYASSAASPAASGEPSLLDAGKGAAPSGPQANPRPVAIPAPIPVSAQPNAAGTVWDPINSVWRSPTGQVLHVGDGPDTTEVPGQRQIVPAPGGAADTYMVPGDPTKTVYTRDAKDPTLFHDATGADYRIVGQDQQSKQDVAAFLKANPQDPGNRPQSYAPAPLTGDADTNAFDRLGTGFVQGGMNVARSLEGADAAIRSNPLLNAVTGGMGAAQPPAGYESADLARGILTRNANDLAYGQSGAYNLGKFGGEVAGTVPAMMATEGAGGALADTAGLGDLFAAAPGTPFLSRAPAMLATNVAKGGFYGGEGAALTSAGSSEPFGQQVTQGAETGAVVNPFLTAGGAGARGVMRFAGNLARPFLPDGAESIADASLGGLSGGAPLDLTEYVPGSKPTFAQALPADNQTAKTAAAVQQRTLMQDQATNAPLTQTLSDADKARAAEVEDLTAGGDPSVIARMKAARDVVTGPLRDAAFAAKTPVDPTPVLNQIDQILASPAGQRDAVVSNLTKIRDKLATPVDAGGPAPVLQLQTDPEQLYGVRQAIDDQLSPLSDEKSGRLAALQLRQVQGALDPVIASGAPGYPTYMSEYAAQSRPINALEYLQSLKLGGTSGQPTLASVNRAAAAVQADLHAPGIQDAKSLDPVQVQRIYNLQADLQRADLTPSLKYAARAPVVTGNADNADWVNKLLQHPAADMAVGGVAAAHPPLGFALGVGKNAAQLGSNFVKRALANRVANPETIQPLPPPPNKLLLPNAALAGVGVAGGQTAPNRFGF